MRNLNTLLTSEMNQEEWTEFRQQWMDAYVTELMLEGDIELPVAEEVADARFEQYIGQEGFTMRDEEIALKRGWF